MIASIVDGSLQKPCQEPGQKGSEEANYVHGFGAEQMVTLCIFQAFLTELRLLSWPRQPRRLGSLLPAYTQFFSISVRTRYSWAAVRYLYTALCGSFSTIFIRSSEQASWSNIRKR